MRARRGASPDGKAELPCDLAQGLGGQLASLEASQPFRRRQGKHGLVDGYAGSGKHETGVPTGDRRRLVTGRATRAGVWTARGGGTRDDRGL